MVIHLGFDMGIRNLAYCMVQHDPEHKWTILHWDNIDLLEGGVSSQTSRKCCACSHPARFVSPDGKKWCTGCATGKRTMKKATEKPVFPVLPCELQVKPLKELAIQKDIPHAKKMKKDELITRLTAMYLVPWKPERAMDSSLTNILKAMDTWLNTVLPTFAQSTLIRLENQPVMKGPTMKSVQIILFTLLSHRLRVEHGWGGAIEFVHAGTKSKKHDLKEVVPTVPAVNQGTAYRARKRNAEDDALDVLKTSESSWLSFFQSRSKKSDLADALLMALRK